MATRTRDGLVEGAHAFPRSCARNLRRFAPVAYHSAGAGDSGLRLVAGIGAPACTVGCDAPMAGRIDGKHRGHPSDRSQQRGVGGNRYIGESTPLADPSPQRAGVAASGEMLGNSPTPGACCDAITSACAAQRCSAPLSPFRVSVISVDLLCRPPPPHRFRWAATYSMSCFDAICGKDVASAIVKCDTPIACH